MTDRTRANNDLLARAQWMSTDSTKLPVTSSGRVLALSVGSADVTIKIDGVESPPVTIVIFASAESKPLPVPTTSHVVYKPTLTTSSTTTTTTTAGPAPSLFALGPPEHVRGEYNSGDASWLYDRIIRYDPPATGDPPTDFRICLKVDSGFETCGTVTGQGSDYTYQPIIAIDGTGSIIGDQWSGNVIFDPRDIGTDLQGLRISLRAENAEGVSKWVTIPG